MGGGQSDLVAVGGVSRRRLQADDPLGQLAPQGLGDRLPDVARTRDAHRLIDVAAARQRVADRPAQAGRSSAERLDFGGMVMGFVLELQQPPLRRSVGVHIHEDAARIVLLAHFEVVEQPPAAKPAGPYRGQIHQAQGLVVPPQLPPHLPVAVERAGDLLARGRRLDGDSVEAGGEGGVAAVVAPVGVQDAQFGLGGVAPLAPEIVHHHAQVVGVHRQPFAAAVCGPLGSLHPAEPREHGHRLRDRFVGFPQHGELFFAALHRIDAIAAHGLHALGRQRPVEEQQTPAADAHRRFGIDQPHALHGRGRPLVELPRQALPGQESPLHERALLPDGVGRPLPEHPVAARAKQLLREAEEVIDAQQAQFPDAEFEVGVQLPPEALGLHPHTGFLFDKKTIVLHYPWVIVSIFLRPGFRPRSLSFPACPPPLFRPALLQPALRSCSDLSFGLSLRPRCSACRRSGPLFGPIVRPVISARRSACHFGPSFGLSFRPVVRPRSRSVTSPPLLAGTLVAHSYQPVLCGPSFPASCPACGPFRPVPLADTLAARFLPALSLIRSVPARSPSGVSLPSDRRLACSPRFRSTCVTALFASAPLSQPSSPLPLCRSTPLSQHPSVAPPPLLPSVARARPGLNAQSAKPSVRHRLRPWYR